MDFMYINLSKLGEKELSELKSKIKEIDKNIKESNKPKTITISGNDHKRIKEYCSIMNFNIGEWSSKTLIDEIEKQTCFSIIDEDDIEKVIEKEKEDIINKYLHREIGLYRLDKLVVSKYFIFKGYSMINGNPMYVYTHPTKSIKDMLEVGKISINFDLCSSEEIGFGLEHNVDIDFEMIDEVN